MGSLSSASTSGAVGQIAPVPLSTAQIAEAADITPSRCVSGGRWRFSPPRRELTAAIVDEACCRSVPAGSRLGAAAMISPQTMRKAWTRDDAPGSRWATGADWDSDGGYHAHTGDPMGCRNLSRPVGSVTAPRAGGRAGGPTRTFRRPCCHGRDRGQERPDSGARRGSNPRGRSAPRCPPPPGFPPRCPPCGTGVARSVTARITSVISSRFEYGV